MAELVIGIVGMRKGPSQRAGWFEKLVQELFPGEETWRKTLYDPRARPRWPQAGRRLNAGRGWGDGVHRPQDSHRSGTGRAGRGVASLDGPEPITGPETASDDAAACPGCGKPSESDPRTGETKPCGTCRARRMWARSRRVPLDPDSAPRRWATLRHLWPPGHQFPSSLRVLPWRDGGGSLVACFAPLDDWLYGDPDPSGIQLIHMAPDGRPRTDRGGLGKRSHGVTGGAVVLIGDPLPDAGRVHVVEGVADALAVAAREDGAVVAVGGTSGFAQISPALARLGVPVVVWPDGDEAGRKAANNLARAIREHGALADVARIPDGHDAASLAGPRFTNSGKWKG